MDNFIIYDLIFLAAFALFVSIFKKRRAFIFISSRMGNKTNQQGRKQIQENIKDFELRFNSNRICFDGCDVLYVWKNNLSVCRFSVGGEGDKNSSNNSAHPISSASFQA